MCPTPTNGAFPDTRPSRRTVLALGVAALAAGCGEDTPVRGTDRTVSYGDDPSQFAELSYPSGESRGVVVVIHGGFWKAAYDASLGRPLVASLVE